MTAEHVTRWTEFIAHLDLHSWRRASAPFARDADCGHDLPEDRCLEPAFGNQEVFCAGSFSEARECGAGQEGAKKKKKKKKKFSGLKKEMRRCEKLLDLLCPSSSSESSGLLNVRKGVVKGCNVV